MDGFQATKAIKAIDKSVKVYGLSAGKIINKLLSVFRKLIIFTNYF
jgi:hypothetical protein